MVRRPIGILDIQRAGRYQRRPRPVITETSVPTQETMTMWDTSAVQRYELLQQRIEEYNALSQTGSPDIYRLNGLKGAIDKIAKELGITINWIQQEAPGLTAITGQINLYNQAVSEGRPKYLIDNIWKNIERLSAKYDIPVNRGTTPRIKETPFAFGLGEKISEYKKESYPVASLVSTRQTLTRAQVESIRKEQEYFESLSDVGKYNYFVNSPLTKEGLPSNIDLIQDQKDKDELLVAWRWGTDYVDRLIRSDVSAEMETGTGRFLSGGGGEYKTLDRLRLQYNRAGTKEEKDRIYKEMVAEASMLKHRQERPEGLATYIIAQPTTQIALGYGVTKGLMLLPKVAQYVAGGALLAYQAPSMISEVQAGRGVELATSMLPAFAGGVMAGIGTMTASTTAKLYKPPTLTQKIWTATTERFVPKGWKVIKGVYTKVTGKFPEQVSKIKVLGWREVKTPFGTTYQARYTTLPRITRTGAFTRSAFYKTVRPKLLTKGRVFYERLTGQYRRIPKSELFSTQKGGLYIKAGRYTAKYGAMKETYIKGRGYEWIPKRQFKLSKAAYKGISVKNRFYKPYGKTEIPGEFVAKAGTTRFKLKIYKPKFKFKGFKKDVTSARFGEYTGIRPKQAVFRSVEQRTGKVTSAEGGLSTIFEKPKLHFQPETTQVKPIFVTKPSVFVFTAPFAVSGIKSRVKPIQYPKTIQKRIPIRKTWMGQAPKPIQFEGTITKPAMIQKPKQAQKLKPIQYQGLYSMTTTVPKIKPIKIPKPIPITKVFYPLKKEKKVRFKMPKKAYRERRFNIEEFRI